MKKVGIIGCGAIGALLAQSVENRIVECDGLILYDYNAEKADSLAKSLSVPVKVVRSVDEMIGQRPVVVVEAASQQAVREYAAKISNRNIKLIVMSVGALLTLPVKDTKIYTPSGAIGGLDAISAAALAGVDDVLLTTRKNPKVLDLQNREEEIVFDGRAEDAVRLFPREMNVAASLALTVGSEKVRVKVVSDPAATRNEHEIQVKWRHGEMLFRFANEPHPESPGTSALAAWSATELLKRLLEERV